MTSPYTTLTDVRAWLTGINQSQTTDDKLLTSLIERASAFIDTAIGRSVLAADYAETMNGFGASSMYLKNFPIISITALMVDGFSYAPAQGFSLGYTFDTHRVYLRGGKFRTGVQNVMVAYRGGYEIVPSDIQQACLELVVFKYKQRNHVGVTSHSQDRVTVDNFIQSEVPPEVQCVLDRYKRTMYLG